MNSEEKKTNDFTLIWPVIKKSNIVHSANLADITYEAFEEHLFKEGLSDVEYQRYLTDRKQDELVDFTSDSIRGAILIYKYGDRVIKFKAIEDSEDE